MSIISDISEKKQIEREREIAHQQLKRSEEKYRGLLENLKLGVVEVDENEVIDDAEVRREITLKVGEEQARLEKKLEVEIEKRGNTSKVEVELETVIDSTSRGAILDAIVKNSQLTREQINEQLRFDSDDNDNNDFSRNEMRINSDSSELEKLRQENQQLRDEINQLNQKLDDLQQIIMEQMKVIMDTLKNLKSQ